MKISFIVPVYLGEKYLNQFCRSIINQKEKNYEVIFVLDPTKEKFLNYLLKIKSSAPENVVKILINTTRQGRLRSIFEALRVVTGDYVVISSLKDEYNKNFTKEVNLILNKEQPDVLEFKVAFSGGVNWSPRVTQLPFNKVLNPQTDFAIYASSIPVDFNKVVKTEILKRASEIAFLDGESRLDVSLDYAFLTLANSYYFLNKKLKTTQLFKTSINNVPDTIKVFKLIINGLQMKGETEKLHAVLYLQWYRLAVFQMIIFQQLRCSDNVAQVYKFLKKISVSSDYKTTKLSNPYFASNSVESQLLESLPSIRNYKKMIKGWT